MTDKGSGVVDERVARISLVDLAGSERAMKTGSSNLIDEQHSPPHFLCSLFKPSLRL